MFRRLLRRLCESPDDFVNHLRYSAGAMIMEVSLCRCINLFFKYYHLLTQLLYAIDVRDKGDPYIETAEKAMSHLGVAAKPGAFLVDVLPICAPSRLNPGLFTD
jgi:hypothetical protein